MNVDELDAVAPRALGDVVSDTDAANVDADADLHADFHDDLGLDSMDGLNLAIALHEATGIDIPEVDYAQDHERCDMRGVPRRSRRRLNRAWG